MTTGIGGKVAFVTGGASGIGAAVSRQLARLGAKVAIGDLNLGHATGLADELAAEGHACMPVELDVQSRPGIETAIRRVTERFGPLGLAVNNAGISTLRAPLAEQSVADWHLCLAVNLTGVFFCMQVEIAAMLRAEGGAVVNVSSINGQIGVPGTAAYAAAKHGVEGLTKTAALDYARHGIRVNSVAPGYADTPLLASRTPAEREEIMARHPMARLARPDEIASLITFLLSDEAGFITGSSHLADGGYTAR